MSYEIESIDLRSEQRHLVANLSAAAKDMDLPPNWHKWLMAAYMRQLGATQEEAASAAGVCERTIRNWEARADLWDLAVQQSRKLWANEVTAAARARVLAAIRSEQDTDTARWWLERTDEDLAPPKQRVESQHKHLHGVVELPAQDMGEKSIPLEEVLEQRAQKDS